MNSLNKTKSRKRTLKCRIPSDRIIKVCYNYKGIMSKKQTVQSCECSNNISKSNRSFTSFLKSKSLNRSRLKCLRVIYK